ncbi:MAG: IS3 family transposase [Alphaproteobacteria bacterium]|nr:IS3 family transposase [Alphaproteobacteria bacterium]
MDVRSARCFAQRLLRLVVMAAKRPHQNRRDSGGKVRERFLQSDRTYGTRRVWHGVLAEGFSCGLHQIERLMRMQALKARPRRRRLPKDQGERSTIVGNALDRQFEASAPNQKWVAYFTYIWTGEG